MLDFPAYAALSSRPRPDSRGCLKRDTRAGGESCEGEWQPLEEASPGGEKDQDPHVQGRVERGSRRQRQHRMEELCRGRRSEGDIFSRLSSRGAH
ncbi:hypothetical protein NDU88_004571 [Pleurodeles waltl]|uniref:Uncharacterized protein n=1 Tax=Pleurodeles waltl TaxID=8319 RepID=A0AAV7QDE2_PLEWA|nr:hypothetical protein NDU88_004571 [Pleurodeles waltl]